MAFQLKVPFGTWRVRCAWATYADGRPALLLMDEPLDPTDPSPVCVASVNADDAELAEGEICIDDNRLNAGTLESLIAAGIVRDTGRRVVHGFDLLAVCHILVPYAPTDG